MNTLYKLILGTGRSRCKMFCPHRARNQFYALASEQPTIGEELPLAVDLSLLVNLKVLCFDRVYTKAILTTTNPAFELLQKRGYK